LIYVVLACRAVLVGIFVVSLAGKIRGRRAYASFRMSVIEWRVLSRRWSAAAAVGAVAGEAGVVVLLALPWAVWSGFVLAGVMLAAFTVGISLALRRGRTAVCRCFGASTTPLGMTQVVRNLLLLAVCVTGAVGATVSSGPLRNLPGSAVALSAAATAVLFVVRLDDVLALLGPPVSAAATGGRVPEKSNYR
jgi:hypothetical protein